MFIFRIIIHTFAICKPKNDFKVHDDQMKTLLKVHYVGAKEFSCLIKET